MTKQSSEPTDHLLGFVKRRGVQPRTYQDVAVVFMDIVSFSALGGGSAMNQVVARMQQAVKSTLDPHYYWDETHKRKRNKIIVIPTGDGYAVAFHNAVRPLEVLARVDELYYKLTHDEDLKLRFGISRGPHVIFVDLNETLNLIGEGIVRAQRALTIAEPGQILCTDEFFNSVDDLPPDAALSQLPGKWRVKSEKPFGLFSYTSKFGKKETAIGSAKNPDPRFQVP